MIRRRRRYSEKIWSLALWEWSAIWLARRRRGGTTRGTRAGAPLSYVRPSLTDKCVDATPVIIAEPSQQRVRSEVLLEVRANSARIGDLLGSLTATAYEPDPLRQRLNHTRIAEPMFQLANLLAAEPVDGQNLRKQLLMLPFRASMFSFLDGLRLG